MNFKLKIASSTGSIGVIGGADGPTSVIIAKSGGALKLVIFGAAMLATGAAIAIAAAKTGRKKLLVSGIVTGMLGGALLELGALFGRGKS
ncbi:MAG: hypothetical protein ACOYID_03860 [Eubacteriales bacterium]|nr:hypothetical protein [Clostridiales bacterium]